MRLFRSDDFGTLTNNGYYGVGTLQKTTATDEDGCRVITYTDNQGKVVLSAAIDGTIRLETYSVYDDRAQLRYVLSPEASSRLGIMIDVAVLDAYAYRYDYDLRGLMIRKKLPGCETVYMVYDNRDRMVMSQDGNQRMINKWAYSLYDCRNRVIETGEVVNSAPHAELQAAASASNNYTPAGTRIPLQYTLYDNYTPTANVPVYAFSPTPRYASARHTSVAGLVTSVKTRVLDTDTWLITTTYYDEKGRVIQTVGDNIQGGMSRINMRYDFVGNLLEQCESHDIGTGTDIVETANGYDSRGRLTLSSTMLNGVPSLTFYGYDDLGRLNRRIIGRTVTEKMSYNIRGWLTGKEIEKSMGNSIFSMNLRYADSSTGGATACWNGNISEWNWQHGSLPVHTYGFRYDNFNRQIKAESSEGYSERGISYDRNGNILSLQRTAADVLVDNLEYYYDGNKLFGLYEWVVDTPIGDVYPSESVDAAFYGYDANGNMIDDYRRGLQFKYNSLNLLGEVNDGGSMQAKYSWLADGTKLRVRDANGNGFDYLGSLTYTSSRAGLSLESARFGGGIILAGNTPEVNFSMIGLDGRDGASWYGL